MTRHKWQLDETTDELQQNELDEEERDDRPIAELQISKEDEEMRDEQQQQNELDEETHD